MIVDFWDLGLKFDRWVIISMMIIVMSYAGDIIVYGSGI